MEPGVEEAVTAPAEPGLVEMMDLYSVFGAVALVAGIVILLFPKVFFYLIGCYLMVNAATVLLHDGDPLLAIFLGLGGILIFLSPGVVAWFLAFYLLIFAGLLFLWGFWFLAIPALVVVLLVALAPKIVPLFIGGFLTLIGGGTLLASFLR